MKASVSKFSFLVASGMALACAGAPAFAPSAGAGSPQADSSADLVSLLNSRLAPRMRTAVYADNASGRRFLLDRSGPWPLLQFEGDSEVFALSTSSGQRGDEFLKTDSGRVFLRVTELGNVILYMPGDKVGAPVDLEGGGTVIIPPQPPADFDAALADVSARLRSTLDQSPTLNFEDGLEQETDWALDALEIAVTGLRRAQKRSPVEINSLTLVRADKPFVLFDDKALKIGVSIDRGYAGRPSSEAILRAVRLAGRQS